MRLLRTGEDHLRREKGKTMKKGRMLRFLVVFLSGFLATTTSVDAAHFAAAGVQSQITEETSVRFWFLGVFSPPDEFSPVTPTQFQCTVVHQDESMVLRLSASVKKIESFNVKTDEEGKIDTITMTGKVLSLAFAFGRGVHLLTEETDFEVTGVDVALPGAGKDTFALKFRYSMKGIGALLREAIPDLVDCQGHTCTLVVAGTVDKGEIEGHTASGE